MPTSRAFKRYMKQQGGMIDERKSMHTPTIKHPPMPMPMIMIMIMWIAMPLFMALHHPV